MIHTALTNENQNTPSTLLVIDDCIANIKLLQAFLKPEYRILFATNGEEGIRMAAEHHPHLILLDLEMPGIDGFEVCRLLRSNPATSECSVVVVTAHGDSQHEVAALEAGAVDFIPRPLVAPVVRARVRTHVTLRRQTELLLSLVREDGLTGLFNRRCFDETLNTEWERHKRARMPLALAMLDIDHFKAYNDTNGHLQGDCCLKAVALALKRSSRRAGELTARYGGEEFGIVLLNTDGGAAAQFGDYICQQVRSLQLPHPTSPHGVVTVSVGMASLIPQEGVKVEELLNRADAALYRAKSAGRNRSDADIGT